MKKFFQEFKTFVMRGNILDLAVGVMIGGAFGSIVSSLVNDIFMPVIGLITGGFNVSGAFLALDGTPTPLRRRRSRRAWERSTTACSSKR